MGLVEFYGLHCCTVGTRVCHWEAQSDWPWSPCVQLNLLLSMVKMSSFTSWKLDVPWQVSKIHHEPIRWLNISVSCFGHQKKVRRRKVSNTSEAMCVPFMQPELQAAEIRLIRMEEAAERITDRWSRHSRNLLGEWFFVHVESSENQEPNFPRSVFCKSIGEPVGVTLDNG